MSDFMNLIHAVKDGDKEAAEAAISHAFGDVKRWAGAPAVQAVELAAEQKLELVKSKIEAAYREYLIDKFGPEIGAMAAGLADAGIDNLVNTAEAIVRGAVFAPPTK